MQPHLICKEMSQDKILKCFWKDVFGKCSILFQLLWFCLPVGFLRKRLSIQFNWQLWRRKELLEKRQQLLRMLRWEIKFKWWTWHFRSSIGNAFLNDTCFEQFQQRAWSFCLISLELLVSQAIGNSLDIACVHELSRRVILGISSWLAVF